MACRGGSGLLGDASGRNLAAVKALGCIEFGGTAAFFYLCGEKHSTSKIESILTIFGEFPEVYFQFFGNFRKYTLKRVKNDFGKCFAPAQAGRCKAVSDHRKHSY